MSKIQTNTGRPRKFTTEELKEIINLFIEKNAHKITQLSASKLAEYATNELKKPRTIKISPEKKK